MKWYGRWVKDYHGDDAAYKHGISPETYGQCDHAIIIPNAHHGQYEIGVRDNKDGTYAIYFDHYGSGAKLAQMIGGLDGKKLKQHYVKHKTVSVMQKKGFKLTEEVNLENGSMKLVLKGDVQL